jgi:ribosomal RNA-processing protein 12
MRSAAVTALARLVYEFAAADMEIQNMLPSLLQTVLILSDDPSREVTKSMVIFVRISIQQTSVEQLRPLLPEIINSLLKYHRGKDRFREKIKIIIKKLVKFFGYETLMPLVPPSDTRLLTHMRKLAEREARRKSSRRYQQQQVEHDPGYDAMVDSDGEEDSDDGQTLMTGMTRISRMSRVMSRSGKQTLKRGRASADETFVKSTRSARTQVSVRIKNDADGDVMDVKELKTVRFAEANSDDSDSDDDVQFDASGKLVVRDMDDTFASEKHHDEDTNMLSYKSKRSTMSQGSTRPTLGKNTGDGRQKKANRIGSSYKAKKAGGDVKRKDQKYEPYAYVQLDGRNYSRKNRRHAVDQMGSVVQRGNKRRKKN